MANFDYTKYDYDALAAEITRLVSLQGTWTDAYASSTGQVLIQLIAAMTDQLHYMLERRSQENFLPTAQLKTSVGALANLLGYRPKRKTSASGVLQLTLVDANGVPIGASAGNIVIEKYTKITYDVYNFVNTEKHTLTNTQTYPTSINIIEGTVKTLTFDPSDTTSTLYNDNYILLTDYENIAENSLSITTSTQTFNDVRFPVGATPALDSLTFASSTDQAYDIRLSNDGLRILFGDGIYGQKPTGILTVKYIESSGKSVNIVNTGLTFSFPTTTLTDDVVVIPPNTYHYTLVNSTAITGGLDEETIANTKARAPDYVRTAARAVTKHDYEFWSKQSGVGGIVDAKAYGEEEIGISVLNMNNVYIVYLNSTGTAFNITQEQAFRDFMDIYKNLTVHLVLLPAEIIPLQIGLTVKRNTNLTASNSEVYSYLKNDLASFFAYQEGSLGTSAYYSTLVDRYHTLTMTKDGIAKRIADYVLLTVKMLKAFSTPVITQTTTATITYGSNGDTYTIVINGTPYSYVSIPGDTANTVATALAALVDVNAAVTASAISNVITITTATAGVTFTITNVGTTTPLNNRINQTIQLPVSLLHNPTSLQMILPGSVEIINSVGTILYTDNGAGVLANGTIDYITGTVVIPMILANGNYYLRFKQSTDMNAIVNSQQALTYSLPKTNYSDVTELLSTITFV